MTPEEGSAHVVSPAIADDDLVFREYLSNEPPTLGRRMIRSHATVIQSSSAKARPIMFHIVPKRGHREIESRRLAQSHLIALEELLDPYKQYLIDLFFAKVNICFPIFDEEMFRRTYTTNKESMSPSLLCHLYGNSLTYWRSSPRLHTQPCPEQRSAWLQAEDAMNAEWRCTSGISTIISIILNLCGRPSSHHLGEQERELWMRTTPSRIRPTANELWPCVLSLAISVKLREMSRSQRIRFRSFETLADPLHPSLLGNGAMLGMAVALANSFGLNRDPSHWNLSPSEKRFRIRIWWLLVIYDVWSSLAYGTPPHIHPSQCDVPTPAAEDIFGTSAASDRMTAAECFVALITLTQVLGHCLEHVYKLDSFVTDTDLHPDLDSLLVTWEDSLPTDELRRSVLRGTRLNAPGTANLRLAYLSVRLLICRSRLNHVNSSKDDIDSHHNIQARRVCEDIVHLVQELDEACLADFWIPLNAHALTSATTFLMRTALRSKGSVRNPSLKLARTMIDTLQWYRRQYEWDMAENCIANCSDILDKIELVCNAVDQYPAELDLSFLEGFDFAAIDTYQC
ncbi:hypothetical protein LTR56_020732 [Elasticomyces elasticus]|nr:hypothetical protein LTR56_020732 [Elasticomyces elasticus]KAK4914970.1 hypothetical protein LTR49_016835 [Elasticomyces elasticus]KAK5748659.1 hypothetical protein LTS12_021292 [Elasticomyces elasticus]